jgi:hypothetical protein
LDSAVKLAKRALLQLKNFPKTIVLFQKPASMTPKQLFLILIKLLGLFFLKEFLVSAVSFFGYLPFIVTNPTSELSVGIVYILIIATFAVLAFICLSRTEWLFKFLSLESNLSTEPMNFKLHRSQVYMIALISISVYMMLTELPTLIRELYNYTKSSRLNSPGYAEATMGPLIQSTARFILGLCLFLVRRPFTNWLELQRKTAAVSATPAPKN